LRAALRDDAREKWRLPGRLAELLFVLPLVGSAVVGLAALRESAYLFLVNEDSLLEWLQALGFAAAFVFAALLALRRWQAGETREAGVFLVIAAGCLFLTGEELSWGQRVFGFGTPEELEEVNVQDEANVHNIPAVRVGFKLLMLALGLAGAVAPWVARSRGWGRSSLVPPALLSSAFFVVFAYNLGRALAYPDDFVHGGRANVTVARYSEWPEALVAYILLLFLACIWWRAGTRASR